MLERLSPAPPFETIALIRRAAWLHRRAAELSTRQALGSVTVGWAAGGRLVAVLGLWPDGAGAECWLAGEPDGARPHLLTIAREARLTLAAMADHGVGPIIARVRPGHGSGRRLAALAGFGRVPAGAADAAEIYVWGATWPTVTQTSPPGS